MYLFIVQMCSIGLIDHENPWINTKMIEIEALKGDLWAKLLSEAAILNN